MMWFLAVPNASGQRRRSCSKERDACVTRISYHTCSARLLLSSPPCVWLRTDQILVPVFAVDSRSLRCAVQPPLGFDTRKNNCRR